METIKKNIYIQAGYRIIIIIMTNDKRKKAYLP